jgi:hypothetical protein
MKCANCGLAIEKWFSRQLNDSVWIHSESQFSLCKREDGQQPTGPGSPETLARPKE